MTSAEQPMAALEQIIADYPRQLAEATDRVAAAMAQTVDGQDDGGLVTVTASAGGEIISVRVSPRALRDLDAQALAVRVVVAINAALARAEAVMAEATGGGAVPASGTAERMRLFEQRMDAQLDRLDQISRALDRLLD